MSEQELYALLDEHRIAYEVCHHPAVYTVAEADRLVPKKARATKNLFLRDDKKRQFFLVVAGEDTAVDLRSLQQRLGSRRLSFASAELLQKRLGLIPGAVTPFGVLNDLTHEVVLVFDEQLAHQRICAHPLVNTATVYVALDDLLPLFAQAGTPVRFCDVTSG